MQQVQQRLIKFYEKLVNEPLLKAPDILPLPFESFLVYKEDLLFMLQYGYMFTETIQL